MAHKIFESIKKKLGPDVSENYFDSDIMSYINTCLQRLNGLGIGQSGFLIETGNETWEEFEPNFAKLPGIDTFTYLKCRLFFDPSANGTITNTINEQIRELTWTLEVDARRIHDEEE